MQVNPLNYFFQGQDVAFGKTLAALGVQPNGMIQFEITSIDPINSPIKPMKQNLALGMPDVITVRVLNGRKCFLNLLGKN